ncbi:hypothetical protein E3N88_18590 [Mikania micrantha]|uniref:DUF4219 domain-containing protein n=1 Tax=Mikania micrantha TaxID=192012 RepID=A0A5N6NL89_9ASTR|nr:hypothetical protein E3N88_18590 [Mikania micrantha]
MGNIWHQSQEAIPIVIEVLLVYLIEVDKSRRRFFSFLIDKVTGKKTEINDHFFTTVGDNSRFEDSFKRLLMTNITEGACVKDFNSNKAFVAVFGISIHCAKTKPLFQCLMLKSMNYTVWAMRMKTILEANGLWEMIEPTVNTVEDVKKDKAATAYLF